MAKSAEAEGFFNDGLTFLFKNASGLKEVRPKHIHIAVETEEASENESCDVRFYSVADAQTQQDQRRLSDSQEEVITRAPAGPNADYTAVEFSDIAFFRLGFFDYAKLNVQNMLSRYEAKKLYTIDLIIDWDDQRVSIYINDEALKSETFFTQRKDKLESANALSIYGLSPGSVSKFKDIRVCDEICSTEAAAGKELGTLSGAAFGYSFSIVASMSALYFGLLA